MQVQGSYASGLRTEPVFGGPPLRWFHNQGQNQIYGKRELGERDTRKEGPHSTQRPNKKDHLYARGEHQETLLASLSDLESMVGEHSGQAEHLLGNVPAARDLAARPFL